MKQTDAEFLRGIILDKKEDRRRLHRIADEFEEFEDLLVGDDFFECKKHKIVGFGECPKCTKEKEPEPGLIAEGENRWLTGDSRFVQFQRYYPELHKLQVAYIPTRLIYKWVESFGKPDKGYVSKKRFENVKSLLKKYGGHTYKCAVSRQQRHNLVATLKCDCGWQELAWKLDDL